MCRTACQSPEQRARLLDRPEFCTRSAPDRAEAAKADVEAS